MHIFENGKRFVQEEAITTIAVLCTVMKEHFLKYYDKFMSLTISVLTNAHGKEYRLLKGKAMECIGLGI